MCQNDKFLCKTRDSARRRLILKSEASDTWNNFLILKYLIHVNIFFIFIITLCLLNTLNIILIVKLPGVDMKTHPQPGNVTGNVDSIGYLWQHERGPFKSVF